MKKIFNIVCFIAILTFMTDASFAESKLADKVYGDKDCSQHSTKTFKGLYDYTRCKKGLEPSDKSIFKSLTWKKKNKGKFDPNKSCDEYSTKSITGLAAKMKCKRAKKN